MCVFATCSYCKPSKLCVCHGRNDVCVCLLHDRNVNPTGPCVKQELNTALLDLQNDPVLTSLPVDWHTYKVRGPPVTRTWSSLQQHSHGHYSNNTHMVITPTTLTWSSLQQHSHGHHSNNTHIDLTPKILTWSSLQQHSHGHHSNNTRMVITPATLIWSSPQ